MFRAIVSKLKEASYSLVFNPRIFAGLAKVFRHSAATGKGSNICLDNGFLPLPVHFYSPVPDIRDLENRKIWDVRSDLVGIDFRADVQLALLAELGTKYADECRWPLMPTDNPSEFFLKNQSFSYGCAASTHSMIRRFKPRTVVEIGSGMSSRVIARALKLNEFDGSSRCTYNIIDPYPSEIIRSSSFTKTELMETRVELLMPDFFCRLKAGDVLFVDSSHSVKIGGDVNYLFLEILPRLAPGVIVHIHDIALPYEYSRSYATNEVFRQFWTEQYLLQAFLCHNSKFEVMLAMHFVMTDHPDSFKAAFPHYDSQKHPFTSGSFWMRRKEHGTTG